MDRPHAEYAALYERGERLFVLAVAPNGCGKTVCFADLAANRRHAEIRVLVIEHRRELVRQASKKLAGAGVEHGVIGDGCLLQPELHVQVASVQTVARQSE